MSNAFSQIGVKCLSCRLSENPVYVNPAGSLLLQQRDRVAEDQTVFILVALTRDVLAPGSVFPHKTFASGHPVLRN